MKTLFLLLLSAAVLFSSTSSFSKSNEISNNNYANFISTAQAESNETSFEYLNCPVPAGIVYFTYETDRNNVTLSWVTNFEYNNSGFEIERQTVFVNSTGEWSMIGSVAGSGISSVIKNYSFRDERVSTGKYYYRLKQVDVNEDYVYYNLNSEVEIGIKKIYKLSQNYPNPFNPSTKIDFELHGEGVVNIRLYDLSGKELKTILEEFKNPGYYTLSFNGDDLAGGVYIYRMEVDGILKDTKQMILLK